MPTYQAPEAQSDTRRWKLKCRSGLSRGRQGQVPEGKQVTRRERRKSRLGATFQLGRQKQRDTGVQQASSAGSLPVCPTLLRL